jgi:hypothetical protein
MEHAVNKKKYIHTYIHENKSKVMLVSRRKRKEKKNITVYLNNKKLL